VYLWKYITCWKYGRFRRGTRRLRPASRRIDLVQGQGLLAADARTNRHHIEGFLGFSSFTRLHTSVSIPSQLTVEHVQMVTVVPAVNKICKNSCNSCNTRKLDACVTHAQQGCKIRYPKRAGENSISIAAHGVGTTWPSSGSWPRPRDRPQQKQRIFRPFTLYSDRGRANAAFLSSPEDS